MIVKGTVTAIDVGADSIKVAQLRQMKSGQVEVLGLACEDLGELGRMDENEQKQRLIRQRVKALLRREGIRPGPAVLSVNGMKTKIGFEVLPVVPQWRLHEMMVFQAEQQIAQGQPSAYDYRIMDIGHVPGQYVVMLGLAQEDLVSARLADADAIGASDSDVDFGVLGMHNAYVHGHGPQRKPARSKDEDAEEEDETVCLVDIGATEVSTAIVRGDALLFARTQPGGGRRFTQVLADEFKLDYEAAEELKLGNGRAPVHVPDTSAGRDITATLRRNTATRTNGDAEQAGDASKPPGSRTTGRAVPDPHAPRPGTTGPKKPYGQLTPEELQFRAGRVLLREAASLCATIDNSLRYCQREFKLPAMKLDRVLVTGGGSRMAGLQEMMARRLRAPVEHLEPLRNVSLGRLPDHKLQEIEGGVERYASSVGLALARLQERAFHLSLLPAAVKERRRFMATDLFLYCAVALFLIGLLLYVYQPYRNQGTVEQINTALAQVNAQDKTRWKRYAGLKADHQQLQAEVKALEERVFSGRDVLRVLSQLKKLTPTEVWFVEVTTRTPDVVRRHELRLNPDLRSLWRKNTTMQDLGAVYLRGYARVPATSVQNEHEANLHCWNIIHNKLLARLSDPALKDRLFSEAKIRWREQDVALHEGYYCLEFIVETRLVKS